MKSFRQYSNFLFLFLFSACTKDVGRVNRGDYPDEIDKIISNSCSVSGCHNAASSEAAANLNLETWSMMFKGSKNGSPVIPYNSEFSSLCYFVNTFAQLGLQNQPTMPLNRTPLSYAEVKQVKDWIDRGAPDKSGQIKWSETNRKKMYAVNQACDVVTVFDAETKLPMRYIKVGNKSTGNTPHQIRVSPDGKYWYVIFVNNNIIQKFSYTNDSYVGDIPLTPLAAGTGSYDASFWNTFIISDDGKYAYCASLTTNGSVAKVDLENRKLLRFIPGLYYPHGIALNAANDKIYVTSQYSNYIHEMDTAFSYLNKWSLDPASPPNITDTLNPHELILSPDKQNFYITCQGSNEVRVFNISTNAVNKIIPTGIFPQEIVYSTAMNQYFVSCTNDQQTFPNSTGVISRIDAIGNAVTTIKCGFQPHGIAVDETRRVLYVLSRNVSSSGPTPHHTSKCIGRNGFVNFIDLNTFTVLPEKYELSVDPYFIAGRP